MKLVYQNPGVHYSTQSIAEFIKLDEFWSEAIYYYYPDLKQFKEEFDQKGNDINVIDTISATVLAVYQERESEIEQKKISYQETWDKHEELINDYFSSVFQLDTRELFNDLVCNISLNPISPRYLEQKVFDTFYKGDDAYSISNALHEISHYLWFYLWHQRYNDSYENYESPSLIWVLSEAVVEQLLNDEKMNQINPVHKRGNAYSYFYSMTIKGRPFYDYINELYTHNSITDFMAKSYQFMLENEVEVREQME